METSAGIFKSAQSEFKIEDVPEISLAEYMLQKVQTFLPEFSDKPWVIDAASGSKVDYGDVELHSRHVASALAGHVGFKRGDVLFCSANECSHLYVVLLAAWRLGGTTRCCYQQEDPDEVARQMRETKTRVVLMDRDTAPMFRQAASSLGWPVTFLSVGRDPVPDTMHYKQMIQYDLSAFPDPDSVRVNVHTDPAIITSTTGSTGRPKGVMLSHYSLVNVFFIRSKSSGNTHYNISYKNVDNIANSLNVLNTCCCGASIVLISRNISKQEYLEVIMKYKPSNILMFPGIATWFAREAPQHDLNFIRTVTFGGNLLNHAILTLMTKLLPQCNLYQVYGMSEFPHISSTAVDGSRNRPKVTENAGEMYTSSGPLLPFAECKLVHLETEKIIVKRGERGEIYIRSPRLMLGYITPDGKVDRSKIDAEGWYRTGDIGFFDEEDFLYVTGRVNFSYRKQGYDIMPGEIEAALMTHDAVMAAGVVGVPDAEALFLTWAFVVLRDDQHVTAEELQKHVADRLPVEKHLDGGVQFLPELPLNRNNKLDYMKLLELAKTSSPPSSDSDL